MPERNPIPHTSTILFADQIIVEAISGKKSLIGIYSAIHGNGVPTEREFNVYLELTDALGEYTFTLELVHLQSNTVVATGTIGPLVSRERLRPMEIVLRLPARLPAHGTYEFRLACGQSVFASRLLHFRPAPNAKDMPPSDDSHP